MTDMSFKCQYGYLSNVIGEKHECPGHPQYKISWTTDTEALQSFNDGFADGFSRGWTECWKYLVGQDSKGESK